MPNDPREDEMYFETRCDLLERELKTTLEDLNKIRKAKSASEATDACWMLKETLANAHYYLRDIQDSISE